MVFVRAFLTMLLPLVKLPMEPFETIAPLDTVFVIQLLATISLALLPISVAESAVMDGVAIIALYVCIKQ